MSEIAAADSPLSAFLRDKGFEKASFKHRPEYSRVIAFFDSVQRQAEIAGCIGEIMPASASTSWNCRPYGAMAGRRTTT